MHGASQTGIPGRKEVIRRWKEKGGLVAAVFPIHYPRALFEAFGVLPVEVWGPPSADPGPGSSHVQPYVCSLVRNSLSFVHSGDFSLVDLVCAPHGCDSLQGLGSLLTDFIRPEVPVIPLYLPRGERREALSFLAAELQSTAKRLEEITGKNPSAEEMERAIEADERARELAGELLQRRRELPLSTGEFYRVLRSREYLPAEEFSKLALAALSEKGAHPEGIPIVLSGIVPEPRELLDELDGMGALVVADDTAACGRRLYPAGNSGDPFVRMAESILSGPPDPARGASISERADHLLALARSSGARGILFYETKFCEPELFYLPLLRETLTEKGLPSTVVEVDVGEPLSGRVTGRISAFLEMLRQ